MSIENNNNDSRYDKYKFNFETIKQSFLLYNVGYLSIFSSCG